MKFKDIFKINDNRCWKKCRDCFYCKNKDICSKLNEYKNEQDEFYIFKK